MPSFSDYIQAAALQALGGAGTFAQETREQATLTANSNALPLIVFGDFTTSQKGTSGLARADLSLFFGDARPGEGDDPEADLAAITRMDTLKRRFLGALDANALVEVTNMRATPFRNVYEAELVGVGVQLTLGIPAASLLAYCLPDPPPVEQSPEPSIVPGYSNSALLLALIQNGTVRPGHETSAAYGSDYR